MYAKQRCTKKSLLTCPICMPGFLTSNFHASWPQVSFIMMDSKT